MDVIRSLSPNSLERLVPEALDESDATGADTLELHMARYRFASRFVVGGRVLDCACGVGYGTALLGEAKKSPDYVLGVDIDPAAVSYATRTYRSERVIFRAGDGTQLRDTEGFDTIVSLETVEHVPNPEALIENFVSLLKPGGKLIASVPVTPSVDVNPYHLHDFTERSFRRLGASFGLVEIDTLSQDQPFSPWRIATGKEVRLDDMRRGMMGYYMRHPAAFARRVRSTIFDGFRNKYLTIVWSKPII